MKVQTYTGVMFDILEPRKQDIRIEDIGRGLSNQARFNGQSALPITIAQHSLELADKVDLSKKGLGRPGSYMEYYRENNILELIFDKYGINWPLSNELIKADKDLTEFELNYRTKEADPYRIMTCDKAYAEWMGAVKEII